jgi:hypothetical protein
MASAPSTTDSSPATSYIDLPFFAKGFCAATDPNSFYISCANHCLYYLDGPARSTALFAGQSLVKGRVDGHRLSQATFNFGNWNGLCILRSGALLISEGDSHLIRHLKGDQVETWAGTGDAGLKDGPRLEAQFNSPCQIVYCAALDSIVVSDYNNDRIRIIKDSMVTSIGISIKNPFRVSLCGTILTVSSPLDNFFTQLDLERRVSSPIPVVNVPVARSSVCHLTDQSILVLGQYSTVMHHLMPDPHSPHRNTSNTTRFKESTLPPLKLKGIGTHSLACLDSSRQYLLVAGGEIRCALTDLALTSLAPSVAINPIDLGQLLQKSALPADLAPDIHIVNKPSDTHIYLHKLIAEAYRIDMDKLQLVLEHSKLPRASLNFFIETLYSPDSSLELLERSFEAAAKLLHCIHLYVSVGIRHTNLIFCATNSILPELPGHDICSLMWDMWQDCVGEHTTAGVLAPFVRPLTSMVASQADEKKQLITKDPCGYTEFLLQLSFDPTSIPSAKLPAPCDQLARQIQTIGWSVHWQDCCPEESTPPGFMRIGIIGHPRELQANMFVVYAFWSFVRRLFESGMSESRSRRFDLPPEFPPSLLYSLALCLHGIEYFGSLSEKDCVYLLENLGPYDIEQSPALKPLQDHCKRVIFVPLTVDNCIDALLIRQSVGTDEEIGQVVEFIAQSVHKRQVDDGVWDSLPPKLLRDILKAIWKQPLRQYNWR